MGMSVGQGGGKKHKVTPQMNVTPLVDVVLVLLIIFMVVTPLLTKQFWINVPKKDDEVQQPQPDDAKPPAVLSLAADGSLRINKDPIEREATPRWCSTRRTVRITAKR
jgi:biopolymer transport protein ExbD/biopolymer transport protein TolR